MFCCIRSTISFGWIVEVCFKNTYLNKSLLNVGAIVALDSDCYKLFSFKNSYFISVPASKNFFH